MKRTLLPKFIIGYIILGVLGFVIISTYSSKLVENYCIEKQALALNREANLIAQKYIPNYYHTDLEVEDLKTHFAIIAEYLESDIWLLGSNGTLLINTNSKSNPSSMSVISGFNSGDLGNKKYQIGNYYDYFDYDVLSVTYIITQNYKPNYLVIHYPMDKIYTASNQMLNIVYISFGILYLCSFIIFLLFLWQYYVPVSKIALAAKEYSDGNFEHKLSIRSSDELGYLGASITYMAQELNTLEDYQKKFVANISHDFRSPLTSIKGYIEAIVDGTIPPENQEKYLKTILYETDRLTKLTQSLLMLNNIDSKKNKLEITDFDINQIIKQTAETFEGTCKKKKITIDLLLADKILYVSADMGKIQQVLYNLIDNAIKFSHDNSVITIETTTKYEKVFLSVKDTGIGIPKDSLKKIFERFYKTDLSRGKDKKGTGLGLSIVKEIVQSHNENINVISTEGVGTEFIFTIPKAKNQPKIL